MLNDQYDDQMMFDEEPQDDAGYDDRRSSRGGRFGGLNGLTQNPMMFAGIAFVIGLLIGWMVFGWFVWPVNWENASALELRPDLQVDYMRMAIDSYNLRLDLPLAQQRVNELGDAAPAAIATVAADPRNQSQEGIRVFQGIVQAGGGVLPAANAGDTGNTTVPDVAAPAETGGPNVRSLFFWACGLTLVLGVALVALYFLRSNRKPGIKTPGMKAQEISRAAEATDYEALGQEAPISQWMTTYVVGDDLFDDSFSIDAPTGEFRGECGVGIADTIGVGEPKRVSAFEIWLFDKNDIQTVTKVVMSHHVYNDDNSRERLAAKGEPFVADPGQQIVLDTETLEMVARVVDVAYGEGALPDNSFFERVTLELAIWSKT